MSTTPTPGMQRKSGDDDIYAALIFIAFLAVLIATIYLGYRAQVLFGKIIPIGGV